jgi:hypothetical protein
MEKIVNLVLLAVLLAAGASYGEPAALEDGYVKSASLQARSNRHQGTATEVRSSGNAARTLNGRAPRGVPAGQILAAKGKTERNAAQTTKPAAKAEALAQRRGYWKSKELNVLAIGMGVGDVTGDGKNDVVVLGPSSVYLYRFEAGMLTLVTEYGVSPLECKSVDVAQIRKRGPCRIYVTAQNRGALGSFVLEFREGKLVQVVRNFVYYLRVIAYPTRGPILLGQQKGLNKYYEGPIYTVEDKGDELVVGPRFGVPLKIPIFGFAIGDFEGNRKPMIAVYDREDHLRIYRPSGKRLFISREYYGGTDILLRMRGPEEKRAADAMRFEPEQEFCRPRIMALDLNHNGIYQILAITHKSTTRRMFTRTKMLGEGQIKGLRWNGDALEQVWSTPKIDGTIADFAVASIPGLPGLRLVTLERKKTDWLSFLRSKSLVKAYDLRRLMKEKGRTSGEE